MARGRDDDRQNISMDRRPALIVAHPGHELVLFGWMEETQPVVTVLTDGSGRDGASRLASTLNVLRETGAVPSDRIAPRSDREFYAAVLSGNIDLFIDLATTLGDELAERETVCVAGDAREGFNPIHDICRMIIDAAVARAQQSGSVIANYEFSLFQPHDRIACDARQHGVCRILSEEQFQRKIDAATNYPELATELEWAFTGSARKVPQKYPDLASIVDGVIGGMNERSFATECLLPGRGVSLAGRPFYERYAERLVADGRYEQAIRYREHVQPIELALAAL